MYKVAVGNISKKHRTILILLVVIPLVVSLVWFYLLPKVAPGFIYSNTYDMKDVGKGGAGCLALSPECGHCPGKKINTICYYND